ncbi:MAG: HAD-IB family phosphatase [Euryarchaeota archaeon]|nr:HAD-IB family phosphatase [Euryarchaeota archaeon]
MDRRFDLIVFDMDGTLVDELSSWEWVHRSFGTDNTDSWLAYQRGDIDDMEFMRRDIDMWLEKRGRVHVDDVRAVLDKVPLMPGAGELFSEIRRSGARTALITGGIDILAERVCHELGIDHFLANAIEVDHEGYLNGRAAMNVPIRGKSGPTRSVLERFKATRERSAAVGNSRFDAEMFKEVGTGFAVNPFDDHIRRSAHHVFEGKDLTRLIPHLTRPDGLARPMQ